MTMTPTRALEKRHFRYSLSIGWFCTDVPVPARFDRARQLGFRAVEMFWPGEPAEELRRAQRRSGVDVALVNMFEGDYAAGDRGFACDPARRETWREALDRALDLATDLSCRRVNVLTGDVPRGRTRAEAQDCVLENLDWAAPRATDRGVTLLIEPLNHLTHPHYLCQRTSDVLAILDELDRAGVALQYDLFHAQCSEGNLIGTLRQSLPRIGHVQLADVPTRSAPGTGEINFGNVLGELAELGYEGFVGLEYDPSQVEDPFAWLPFPERSRIPRLSGSLSPSTAPA
ncbi:TIM barrel protein [Brooklawnia cerclae]|uniref:Hydroxypyruvate isomerase n=2 Tax=Brooklawnia cerclae TaxID=349934 RepID=A0ABX0SC01_9ACTN|nr:hydroxypyruvate isomerase [Brooklawnia cerclae]